MAKKPYWLVREIEGQCYYSGYFKKGKAVFCMAILDAVLIASESSAQNLFKVLNKIVPYEILLVSDKGITQVVPV